MPVQLAQLGLAKSIVECLSGPAKAPVEVIGAWGSGKTLAAVQTAEALGRSLFILAAGRIEAEAIFEDLVTFAGEARAALFPAWEVLPTDVMAPADDIIAERMDTLERMRAAAEAETPLYVVAPVRSLLQYVVARDRLLGQTLSLAVGEEHRLDDLVDALSAMGYERELMVEQRGQMSVRGGIFDVFPIAAELPYRIEFFDDEIESIRPFEPETQRSVDHVQEVRLLPRSEKAFLSGNAEALGCVVDYLPRNAIVALDEPKAIEEEAARVQTEAGETAFFMTWDEANAHLASFAQIALAQVAYTRAADRARVVTAMGSMDAMGSMAGWQGHPDEFWGQLEQWNAEGYTVVLLCHNTGQRQRLHELLSDRGYRLGSDEFDLRVEIGRLRAGFSSSSDRLAVLSEREMFGRRSVRRRRRRFEAGENITAFSDLRSGDYVVHVHHGIGRYLGLRRFEGKAGDFLAIQYGSGDRIYVPVSHIDSVQKYTGGDSGAPKIDKLGGVTWARTKARVKKAVHDMTEELLKVHASRESQPGFAFGPDTPWQTEFEDAFEYEETPDQARAIVETKRDMEKPKPMERLICGDVGFGKTEVALRAAFKAVMGGRQVAVLVPTTVLAEQHYLTFTERLADYPVTVEMLSRFRTVKEQQSTVERLKSGEVDIVIGTHRLVSKDVKFKNLGLLVIDEEQRFGVAQKERLKQLRKLVDVVTMSATPIPRTLNFSLMGVRDMSLINTAPNDRLPIHTCIEAFDEELIQEAIRRELARQGQVFFVHNRVQTILPFANLVHRLVPQARVAVGHGQMRERDLENVMADFVRGDVDVLVCTTIIGSGLDIPNANTIIINNADKFGLSDLYQLRGRVGRYKHRAYAYLLVSGDRALSEDAQKRLKALEEFSTLGSGFRIAMRDLEIRGCGDILGSQQHGHIAAVGYDTYMDLVREAVAEIKGESAPTRALPPFEIALDAFVPEDYVPSETQKITLYKRISGVRTVEELDEMADEVADRFGAPPRPVRLLLDAMRVRALAADVGAKRVLAAKKAVAIEFESGHLLTRKSRNTLAMRFGDRLDFAWEGTPTMTLRTSSRKDEDLLQAAQNLLRALGDL